MLKNLLLLFLAISLLSLPDSLFAQNKRITEFIEGIPRLSIDGLTVNHEYPGMTTSPGYDYPDENAGTKLYPETREYYIFSPIARARNSTWILVETPKYEHPVWIDSNNTWSIEKDYDVPVFQKASSKAISIPKQALNERNGIPGTIKSAFGEEKAYSMPQSLSDKVVCKIPNGEKILGVAMLEEGIDVLVKSSSCKGYVWIWKIDVDWEGTEDWTRLNLPIIKPEVSKKAVLPKTEYVTRVKTDAPYKKKHGSLTVVVRDTKGNTHEWNNELPDSYRAKNSEAADLFVTIRKIPNVVDVCTYMPYGAFARIRLDYAVFVTLSDPTKLIAKTIIKGERLRLVHHPRARTIHQWLLVNRNVLNS